MNKKQKKKDKIKKTFKNDETGITLIALVVTIIILLILAGVTIAMLTGENGLLRRTDNAKEKTIISQAEEDIKLRLIESATIGNGKITKESFMQALEEASDTYLIEKKGSEIASLDNKGITTVEGIDGNLYVTNVTKYAGIKVEVTSDFTVVESVSTGTSSGGSASGENGGNPNNPGDSGSTGDLGKLAFTESGKTVNVKVPSKIEEYYGMKVKYQAGEGQSDISETTWRLFYVDFNGDYGERGSIYLKADWDKGKSIVPQTYDSSKTKIRELNPQWSEFCGDDEDSWDSDEKCCAYLSDPTKWTRFASTFYNEGVVKYAIGAPPLEMYVKSYGDKTGNKGYKTKYSDGSDLGNNFYRGYKIKTSLDEQESSYVSYTSAGSFLSSVSNGMYGMDHRLNNTGSWYFCSPSSTGGSMCAVGSTSGGCYIGNGQPGYAHAGYQPMVCLSSEFLIEEIQ